MLNSPFSIGNLSLNNRLIQGPLAGFSCAAFRSLFYLYTPPAYCVTEMISAKDIVQGKHGDHSRYLYRDPMETRLAYQISGTDPLVMAEAAAILQEKAADLIDINCGCPKPKIRKKGAGSALLENPDRLLEIIQQIRAVLDIPLTVKIRIQELAQDIELAKNLEQAGIDALIVHGRKWTEDYDIASNLERIALIKEALCIPVIANGDIQDTETLNKALTTGCDAFMIARAGTGKPWLFHNLLTEQNLRITDAEKENLFKKHIQALADLEGSHLAELQSRKLKKYYAI